MASFARETRAHFSSGRTASHPTLLETRTYPVLDLSDLRAAVRSEGGASRRLLLAYGAALSALPIVDAGPRPGLAARLRHRPVLPRGRFGRPD